MTEMPKIIIVEDDQAIREMYQLKLEAEGFSVYLAKNGKEGLIAAETYKPDIILLDLMMPEMTGGEMLAKLRASEWGKKIKVIILTNVSRDEAMDAVKALKIEGLIVKADTTPSEVVEAIKKLL